MSAVRCASNRGPARQTINELVIQLKREGKWLRLVRLSFGGNLPEGGTPMNKRKLGQLEVSAVGLGCMGMSGAYGSVDQAEAIATIRRALELGVMLLDTADFYGTRAGENESLIGHALHGQSLRPALSVKFGPTRTRESGWGPIQSRPEQVRPAAEASLKRLGVDVIDLYTLARVNPDIPIEDTVGAMGQLVQAGLIRFIGLSEVAPATIRKAHTVHPLTAVQTEYSLWSREPEDQILPTCRELGIGFVAYSPLSRGFLSGDITTLDDLPASDARRGYPRFQGENFQKNLAVVEQVRQIAAEKGVTPSQLAIAWVLAQGEEIVPIPGTKRVNYLEENIAAADIQLSRHDLERIERVAPKGSAAGERYPAAQLGLLNQ
jgi:aryl-alcohol dehydrogenase-like predicted oxidoreductase